MTMARHLQRGDTLSLSLPKMRVLDVERVTEGPNGIFKIRLEALDAPTLQFGDGGCVLEILCKGGRPFAGGYRNDWPGGGGGDEPDPLPPSNPELSKEIPA